MTQSQPDASTASSASRGAVIVGASLAGSRCALTLRRGGYQGPITLVGDEVHAPYDRPPLSKDLLTSDAEPESVLLDKPDAYAEADVQLLLGARASALDADTKVLHLQPSPGATEQQAAALGNSGTLRYDHLVIATGASARQLPPSVGSTPAGVFTLRTLDDSLAIRERLVAGARVVVVGAGFIGSEVAGSAKARGCDVTVVELAAAPLARGLGTEVGNAVGQLHATNDVRLLLNAGLEGFVTDESASGQASVRGVRLSNGNELPADVVVVGVGVTPNVGWLEGSGVALAPRFQGGGVLCDAHLATNAPDVYALGDVASAPNLWLGNEPHRTEHWTAAVEHAMLVASNVTTPAAARPYRSVPFVWSDQYDARVQLAGDIRAHLEVRMLVGELGEPSFVAGYTDGERLCGVAALNSVRGFVAFRRLLAGDDRSWDAAIQKAVELSG